MLGPTFLEYRRSYVHDEPKHRDETTLIIGKIGEIRLNFILQANYCGAMAQDKLLPGCILIIFEVVIVVINRAQPFC